MKINNEEFALLFGTFNEEFVLPRPYIVIGVSEKGLLGLLTTEEFAMDSHEELIKFIEGLGFKVIPCGTKKNPLVHYSYVDEGVLVVDIENYEN